MPTMFIGYSTTQKEYKLYDLHSHTFLVSRHVLFQEDLFSFKHMKAAGTPIFLVLDHMSSNTVHYRNENIHVPSPSTCPPKAPAISPHHMETLAHSADASEVEVEQAAPEQVLPSSAVSPMGPRRFSRTSMPPL